VATFIGLYHPFMHFQDDRWVKLATLYWDKLARIVPPDHPTEDSETVRQLMDAGFIRDFPPDPTATKRVGQTFVQLVHEHGDALSQYFKDRPADALPRRQGLFIPPSAPQPDPRMGYVLAEEKLSEELVEALQQRFLAQPYFDAGSKRRWLAVPPKLATVYVAKLAEEMCTASPAVDDQDRLIPTTDETVNHIGVSGCSVERLAQALLEGANLVGDTPTHREVEATLASLAIQAVVPKNIADVSVENLLQLRERRREELVAFRTHIHERVGNMAWLDGVTSHAELQTRLEVEAEALLDQQETLRESLRSQGIDVVQSALNVSVAAPALFTSAEKLLHISTADPISSALLGVGSLAFSLLPVYRDAQKKRDAMFRSSPAAYLFSVDEALTPNGITSWITSQARRFKFPLPSTGG
jgi:hypothetical protein